MKTTYSQIKQWLGKKVWKSSSQPTIAIPEATSPVLTKKEVDSDKELFVCHIDGIPLIGSKCSMRELGVCFTKTPSKVSYVDTHTIEVLFKTLECQYRLIEVFALEKEDINELGEKLSRLPDIDWVGVRHRGLLCGIYSRFLRRNRTAKTIDAWYPTATKEEIEVSRY